MGRESTVEGFVKEREFVSMTKTHGFARIVVEVHCARPHCVRRRQKTGGTKDIAYVALSICSRMSPSSTITRRRRPP